MSAFAKKELQIKSDQKLSNKDVKRLTQQLAQQLCLLDATATALIGKDIALRKSGGGVSVKLYCRDTDAVLFEVDAHGAMPSLTSLWRLPSLLPPVLVPPPVSEYLLSGASLMLPGVIGFGGGDGLSAGDAVCVLVSGNPAAVAVGRLAISSAELLSALASSPRPKGLAVEVLHVFGDALWRYCGKPIPNAGFNLGCKSIAPRAAPPSPHLGDGLNLSSLTLDGAPSTTTVNKEGNEEEGGESEEGELEDGKPEDGQAKEAERGVPPSLPSLPPPPPAAPLTSAVVAGDDDSAQDGSASRAAMDALLQRCFLRAVHAITDEELPIGFNSLWSSKMRPLRPAGSSLDLKASSYKKLGVLMAAMEADGLCTLKVPKGSGGKKGAAAAEPLLVSISRGSEQYRLFEPWPLSSTAEAAGDGPSLSGSRMAAPRVVLSDVFRPTEPMRPLYTQQGHTDRKAFYSHEQAIAILHACAVAAGGDATRTLRPTDVVTLDPLLADALYKGEASTVPTQLTWRELSKRYGSKLEPWVRVHGGQLEKPITRPGREPPVVRISTAQRRGHMVTLVDELEVLAIPPEQLAHALQAKLGSNATVSEMEVKSGAVKRQVMVQGLWDRAVEEVLSGEFGLPERCVQNTAESRKGMHQKKEKQATNVRRA